MLFPGQLRCLHHERFQFLDVGCESFFELIGRFLNISFYVGFVCLYHRLQRAD